MTSAIAISATSDSGRRFALSIEKKFASMTRPSHSTALSSAAPVSSTAFGGSGFVGGGVGCARRPDRPFQILQDQAGILRTLKTYSMILAANGSPCF